MGITAAIALCFSFVRPYNTVVYAPKLKHADEKHAPPPLGKGIFAWIKPLWSTTEKDLVTRRFWAENGRAVARKAKVRAA